MYEQEDAAGKVPLVEQFYQQHADTIFTHVHLHTSSSEDAEDIVVETFLAALEEPKFPHLTARAQVAWLWRVARHKIIDSYRRANVRRSIPLEDILDTAIQDDERGPEQTVLRLEEEEQVRHLLKALPPDTQQVMWLRFGYSLRCTEIAALLGKRESTVRTTLSRAMGHLRKTYGGQRKAT